MLFGRTPSLSNDRPCTAETTKAHHRRRPGAVRSLDVIFKTRRGLEGHLTDEEEMKHTVRSKNRGLEFLQNTEYPPNATISRVLLRCQLRRSE